MSAGCHELPASTRGYCCWPTFEIPRGTDAHSGAARWFGGRIPAHRFDSIPVLRVTTVNPFKRRGRHHEISAVIGERGRSTQPSAVRVAARTERNGVPARLLRAILAILPNDLSGLAHIFTAGIAASEEARFEIVHAGRRRRGDRSRVRLRGQDRAPAAGRFDGGQRSRARRACRDISPVRSQSDPLDLRGRQEQDHLIESGRGIQIKFSSTLPFTFSGPIKLPAPIEIDQRAVNRAIAAGINAQVQQNSALAGDDPVRPQSDRLARRSAELKASAPQGVA
jgi:hypothetical protein